MLKNIDQKAAVFSTLLSNPYKPGFHCLISNSRKRRSEPPELYRLKQPG